jgi:hypothetical protein
MGNENAMLLFAVPNTNWVNATLFVGDLEEVHLSVDHQAVNPAKPGTRAVCVLIYAARGEFPASRRVLSLTHPEEVGGNEVKQ